MHFTATTLHQTIRFALNGTSAQLSSLNQQIAITAHTQDTGDVERTSTTTWTLQTAANFNDSGGGSGEFRQRPLCNGRSAQCCAERGCADLLTALVDAQIGGKLALCGNPHRIAARQRGGRHAAHRCRWSERRRRRATAITPVCKPCWRAFRSRRRRTGTPIRVRSVSRQR